MKTMTAVYDLVLEVTRRCNMCCEHCLRGDAQDLDMSRETIDAVLDTIDIIHCVTFSGGEPSLNLPIIEYFFERAEALGKLPYSFFIATNGMENQLDLATLLLRWYPKMEDKEFCAIAQSIDQFHDKVPPSPIHGLAFYSDSKTHYDNSTKWVIDTGRAAENGIGESLSCGTWNTPDAFFEQLEVNESDSFIELYLDDTLYVSADGKVTLDCDMSYKDIEEDSLCHIRDLSQLFASAITHPVL